MCKPSHASEGFSTRLQIGTRNKGNFHRVFTPKGKYDLPMKRATAMWLSVPAIALTSFANSASADVNPTPAPTTQAETYKTALEQYKKDREQFNLALRERAQQMRIINQTFDGAIKKARQDSKLAMQVALKPEQKSAINSALKSVIAAAIISREEAIEALGEPPIPPTEPTKAPRGMHSDKNGAEKKRR